MYYNFCGFSVCVRNIKGVASIINNDGKIESVENSTVVDNECTQTEYNAQFKLINGKLLTHYIYACLPMHIYKL